MTTFLTIAVIVILVGAVLYTLGGPDRHAQMTEEEFEEEAKKKSLLGAAMMGVDRVLRRDQVEHVLEQKQRVEKDETPSGDPPKTDSPSRS